MVVRLGKLGQDCLEIKTFGNLELTGGRRWIQLYDRDLINFVDSASDRSGTATSRHAR